MAPPSAPRRDPLDVVRLGLPLSPLTDLYYHLMERSWWLLVGLLAVMYLLTNLAFAVLYLTQGEGINAAEVGSFADAFAFSVQTLSTIGYGTMSPTNGAVHGLVTLEAMTGLLGTAIATGLVFAKFSRPRAKVMFSRPLLITRRNGQPALLFRVGNARGNEIIEASMRMAALIPEETLEGERMRRLVDLTLLRSRTPVFALTWTAVHEIDENSPLHGYDDERLAQEHVRFIVSLTGIDGTFAQTVHARHIYQHEDIVWGSRFVDIVDAETDGQLVIDYRRFHDLEPVRAATLARE